MSKNILILSGSPRKGGNSDILCDRFMEGARESGHRAEKVFLRDRNIGYCIGCEAVSYTHLDVYKRQPLGSVWCTHREITPCPQRFPFRPRVSGPLSTH